MGVATMYSGITGLSGPAANRAMLSGGPGAAQALARLCIAVLAVALAGCAGAPRERPVPVRPPVVTAVEPVERTAPTPARRFATHTEPVHARIARDDLAGARAALAELQRQRPDHRFDPAMVMLEGHLLLAEGEAQAALRLLFATDPIDPPMRRELGLLRAAALEEARQFWNAAITRAGIDGLLDGEVAASNRDRLWDDLLAVSPAELRRRRPDADATVVAWLDLALIAAQLDSIPSQLNALRRWRSRWNDHAAAERGARIEAALAAATRAAPRRVALLVPTSGPLAPAGRAIRHGFLAAWFAVDPATEGGFRPEIVSIDAASGTLARQLAAARSAGVDLIIGPLQREAVQAISALPELPAPVLALNYATGPDVPDAPAPDPGAATSRVWQVGMRSEDEGVEIARRMRADGHRRVLVITEDAAWTTRVRTAFVDAWTALGGTVTASADYALADSVDGAIRDALLVEESTQRAKALAAVLGEAPESAGRRRDDVDAIVLLAPNASARAVRPTLAFHFAGDLPIYATSQVRPGTFDAEAARDLAGIRFSEIPWRLSNDPLRTTLERNLPDESNLAPFHALGVDAWRLASRFALLRAGNMPATRTWGAIGSLAFSPQGSADRTLAWAEISDRGIRGLRDPEMRVHP